MENAGGAALTGEELFGLFLAGDGNAFERIVEMYENDLAHYINAVVRDIHEAKHLTIETFARLAVGGKKFTGKSSLKTYLFAIAKHLAGRHVKKRGSERHIPFEDIAEQLADEGESPQSHMEKTESRRQVRASMNELKDEHRAVLVLLYFEDMSYAEAGRAMGKSENQIKHLAFRAKAALKRRLEEAEVSYG